MTVTTHHDKGLWDTLTGGSGTYKAYAQESDGTYVPAEGKGSSREEAVDNLKEAISVSRAAGK